jgi:hypothetical protein
VIVDRANATDLGHERGIERGSLSADAEPGERRQHSA